MSYKDFEGSIPEGYGAGDVKKMLESSAVIHKISPNHVLFTLGDTRGGNRYSLVNTGGKNWLLRNVTPASAPLTKQELKPKLKNVGAQTDKDKIKDLLRNKVLSPKLDGALTTIVAGKTLEAYSPRTRAGSGLPITYSERLGIVGKPIDSKLKDMVLRGELIAEKNGKVLKPNELSGLLNMNLTGMLKKLKEDNIKLKVGLFDIMSPKAPQDKQVILRDAITKLNPDVFFEVPKYTGREAESVYNKILSGKEPLTSEGVVLEDTAGVKPTEKVKFLNEQDVLINDIFKAITKPGTAERAGGFTYTDTSGKEAGRVGTGFTHDMLKDMISNPDKYIGRTARVRSLDKYPSGALRAPAFIGLHEDY
jgi:ribosomal protein L13